MLLRKTHFKAIAKIGCDFVFGGGGVRTASEEVALHAFNLEDSETDISRTQIGEDGENLPFPLVTDVSYADNLDALSIKA